jgi:autotransporter-associated beta strand protein
MKTQIGKTESPANQEPLGEEIPITLPIGTEARKSQSIPRRNVFTVLALVATFGVGWWREATFGMCIHRGFCNVHRSILGWCVVMLLGLAGEIRAGVVYHVDNGGSDAASGAETAPLRTIAQALIRAQPGDQILLRKGVYREILVANRSGTENAPIVIANYPGERAVVSALDEVKGEWVKADTGAGIYRIARPNDLLAASSPSGDGFYQVFVDGQMAQEARHPNKQSGDLLSADAPTLTMDNQYGFTGLDTSGFSESDLVGARFLGNFGQGWAWQTSIVLSRSGQRIQLRPEKSSQWWWPNIDVKKDSDAGIGYLVGRPAFLDQEGEWAVDASYLYLKLPGGVLPALGQVQAKARNWCVRIQGRNYITLRGLVFVGGALELDGTGLLMENCEASYLSHFQSMATGWSANNRDEEKGVLMKGLNNRITGCVIRDTAGGGVSLLGSRHSITRNTIFNISYAGSYLAPVQVRGDGHVISFNTIRDTGRDAIKLEGGAGHLVSYNEAYRGGRLCKDYGLIYTWNTDGLLDGKATRITRNWLHQGVAHGAVGVYLDNGSRNYIVDHNAIWDMWNGLHANAPGYNNRFFHNTVVSERTYNTSTYASTPQEAFWTDSKKGLQVVGWNNLLVPPGEAAQAFENFGARDFRPKAAYQFADKRYPDASVQALDPTPFSGSVRFEKPAGTGGADAYGMVDNPYLRVQLVPSSDPFFYEEAYGQGQTIPEINEGFVGSAPDSGAYEWGPSPWKAGVDGFAVAEAGTVYKVVAFDPQGGSVPNPATKYVSPGAAYGSLAQAMRNGYNLVGWWTQIGGGTEVTASTVVQAAADHTLYARWEERFPLTWNHLVSGNATGSWSDSGNWSGAPLPTTTNDIAYFNTLNLTAHSTVSLDGNQAVNKLFFADATTASHNWSVVAGAPGTSMLTLGGTNPEISVTNQMTTISATIAGGANWTKTGGGTLLLNNTGNHFSGDVTIQAGVLEEQRGALGSTVGKTVIHSTGATSSGGQLIFNPYGMLVDYGEPVVIQGPGNPANGSGTAALRFAGAAGSGATFSTMNGVIMLNGTANYKIDVYLQPTHWKINGGIARSGANTGTLFLNLSHWQQTSPVRLTINSLIDNNGGPVTLLGDTAGLLQMDMAGHDMGDFTINGAYNLAPTNYQTILKLGIDNALNPNKNLTITKGTLDLGGFNQTVNALSGVLNASLIFNSGTTASKLTLGNGGGNGTYSGAIADGNAAISLEKIGNGTQTLAGNNTYSGETRVSSGTLVIKQANKANELASVTVDAGAFLGLDFAGTDTVGKLFLGTPAVQVPAGTYNASHPSYGAYFRFGGSLVVSTGPPPISGFSGWITRTFTDQATTPSGKQGYSEDPDGDGISNLLEYAIADLDPTVPNGAVGFMNGMTLTFNKRQPLATDISYVIETTSDVLAPWTTQVTHTAPYNTDPIIAYTLPANKDRFFARLKIIKTTPQGSSSGSNITWSINQNSATPSEVVWLMPRDAMAKAKINQKFLR